MNRPWGEFFILLKGKNYLVKKLIIKPKQKTSLQYHNHRKEYWFVLEGKGKAIIDNKEYELLPEIFLKIEKKQIHRIINPYDEDLVILEIWVGEVLDENDIVRLEDSYGRV